MILETSTMKDFSRHLRKTKTIIFPFGAVEEHGRHLPLCTDTITVIEILKRLMEQRDVFLAPSINYGVMRSNSKHPGTLGISAESLRRTTVDLIRDAYRQGLRNFLLVSGHGGSIHMAALKEVAELLIDELDSIKMAVFCIDDILLEKRAEISETSNDSHAGELETSIMLYIAPAQVKGRSKEEYPRRPDPFVVKDKLKYWPGGVWGNPAKASENKGEKAVQFIVDKLVYIVDTIEKKNF